MARCLHRDRRAQIADHFYDTHPNGLTLRVISQVAAVTAVIYLTGWGPVSGGRTPSSRWRTLPAAGPASGARPPSGASSGWPPANSASLGAGSLQLTRAQSTTLTVMGRSLFVIRMAGAIMEQKERMMEQKAEAETTLRMSEDRFRSLIQNSSDVTMILDEVGDFRYVSPAIKDLLQYDPEELVGHRATDYVHPVDLDLVQRTLGADFQAGPGPRHSNSAWCARTERPGTWKRSCATRLIARPWPGRQHTGHHRAQEVRGPSRPSSAPRPAHGLGEPPADPRSRRADVGACPAYRRRAGGGPLHRSTSRTPTTRSGTDGDSSSRGGSGPVRRERAVQTAARGAGVSLTGLERSEFFLLYHPISDRSTGCNPGTN